MGNVCHSLVAAGASARIIDIECTVSNNLPTIVIVGSANKAVNEARDRLRGAFMSSQLKLPRKRITINLAPADIPKSDSGLDLAMAAAILLTDASAQRLADDAALIGELSLDGSVRPVRGIIGKILAGRDQGLHQFYVPAANLSQAQLIPGIQLTPLTSLSELYSQLHGQPIIQSLATGAGVYATPEQQQPAADSTPRLSDIVGQDSAKRALLIAAAGGHNLLLTGPPGTGKSLLAKTLPALLPPLTREEALEVTQLHSLSGHEYDQLATERPLRNPHHSASYSALVGGGLRMRPGEISLSHRGILLLDEFPEFSRQSIEALRQPLEDQVISVVRAKESARFPANFTLIATANPCPCGFLGSTRQACTCGIPQLKRYETRLSGPILDRIDLCCSMYEVDHQDLLRNTAATTDDQAKELVTTVRAQQAKRYDSATTLNSDLTNRQLRQYARLTHAARQRLDRSSDFYKLSARAYMRTVKVARTIADMDDSVVIQPEHIAEALTYRLKPTLAGGLTSGATSVKMLSNYKQGESR